jgi:hypothetical protein
VCIDCDACPVDAIFAEFEIPEKFTYAREINAPHSSAGGDRSV